MMSSNRFGGRGTTAGSRVQIGSAGQAESGTIFPAQEEPRGSCQGELLSDHIADVHMGRAGEQRIEVRIIRRLGVAAEHGRIHIDVYLGADIGQATPAFSLHDRLYGSPPEVLTIAGCLKLAFDRHRAHQVQIQAFKCGVVGLKLTDRPHGAPLEVPDVHSQHSRLN
jgi:hypothetical protein